MQFSRLSEKWIIAAFLFVILAIGTYARAAELAWHFTNVDDLGIIEHLFKFSSGKWDISAISARNTNAPLQFFFTNLIVHPEQDYREVLFWGRLPSCVFGIIGLFALAFFYWQKDRFSTPAVLIGTILLAFSWENIAHAKQSNNYAAGVTAAVLVLVFLTHIIRRGLKSGKISWRMMLTAGFFLALLSHIHYQVIIFVSAFYLSVIVFRPLDGRRFQHMLKCVVSALFYLALIFPMWYFFLSRVAHRGTSGYLPGIFSLPAKTSIWNIIAYIFNFFWKSFIDVFQTRLGFTPEGGIAYQVLSAIFLGLFIAGIFAILLNRHRLHRSLAVFLLGTIAAWFALVVMHKLCLEPTRRSLIFLPIIAVIVGEGFVLTLASFSAFSHTMIRMLRHVLAYGFVLVLMLLFIFYYPLFLEERRDPFREDELFETLQQYGVTDIIADERSTGVNFMKKLQAWRTDSNLGIGSYRVIARISRYPVPTFDLEICEDFRHKYNYMLKRQNSKNLASYPCSDYEVVFSKVIDSDVQVNFTRKIHDTILTNAMYFHIVALKTPAPEEVVPDNMSGKQSTEV